MTSITEPLYLLKRSKRVDQAINRPHLVDCTGSNGFELRNSPEKGEGVFATLPFKKNEVVMVGKIEKELDENHSHASQIARNVYIFHAGLISKVNHSCDPNCGIKVNKTGAHDFVARRSIGVNEEITFDYAMRNYGVDYFPKQCMCGTMLCRGGITGWKDLPDERKQEYEGFVAPYLMELDAEGVDDSLPHLLVEVHSA